MDIGYFLVITVFPFLSLSPPFSTLSFTLPSHISTSSWRALKCNKRISVHKKSEVNGKGARCEGSGGQPLRQLTQNNRRPGLISLSLHFLVTDLEWPDLALSCWPCVHDLPDSLKLLEAKTEIFSHFLYVSQNLGKSVIINFRVCLIFFI